MTNTEQIVMRRVRTIHTLRPFVSGAALSCVLLMAALWGIGREVWVAQIFANMPHTGNLFEVATFYLAAFENTQFVVQVLSLMVCGSLVYLAHQTARLISTSFVFAKA